MKKGNFVLYFIFTAITLNIISAKPNLFSTSYTLTQSPEIIFEEFMITTFISETLAEVNITGIFFNPNNESTTGNFTIDIPQGAYVSNISLQKDNVTYWGRIMRKQEAQEAFENATESNRSAVLLTTVGRYTFRIDFSIEPESRIEVTLTYYKRISRFKGHYDLYMDLESILAQNPQSLAAEYVIISPIRSIENIITPDGAEFIENTTHYVTVRFPASYLSTGSTSISYDLIGASLGNNILAYDNGTNEFFMATFSPSLSELGTDGLAKDFVFVIDVSGSMSGQKIDQAKTSLLSIIEQLHPEDRLGIVKFSSTAETSYSYLINSNDSDDISSIKSWVANLQAGGTTNIYDALILGLDLFDSLERPSILVLLTDGRHNTGLASTAEIEDEFQRANTAEVSLFTLGFGNDVDFPFLLRLARQNLGETVKIDEGGNATEQITDFYESVSTPLLTDIRLTCNSGVVDNVIYPYFIPNLFDGSELFFVGERVANSTIELNITGHSSEGDLYYLIRLTTPSSTDYKNRWIETIWAIAKIDDLLTRLEYGDTANNITETVTSMALFYGIITPYTALFIDTGTLKEEPTESDNYHDAYLQGVPGTWAPQATSIPATSVAPSSESPSSESPSSESPSIPDSSPTVESSKKVSKEETTTTVHSTSPGFIWVFILIIVPTIVSIRRSKTR